MVYVLEDPRDALFVELDPREDPVLVLLQKRGQCNVYQDGLVCHPRSTRIFFINLKEDYHMNVLHVGGTRGWSFKVHSLFGRDFDHDVGGEDLFIQDGF